MNAQAGRNICLPNLKVLAAAFVICGAASGNALASDHEGMLGRASLGFGYQYTSTKDDISLYVLKGVTVPFEVMWGFALAENLFISGNIAGALGWSETTLEIDHESRGEDNNYTGAIFGGGLTYYFMPANVFVTASAGYAVLSLVKGEKHLGITGGFGMNAGVGKEWSTKKGFGVGLGLQTFFLSVPDKGGYPRWKMTGGGAVVTFARHLD